MKGLNYTIIIPHKNIPELLKRCINSVPDRDDLEIIIVDDKSEDYIKKEIREIKRENCKIIFSKRGLGAGHARNIGIHNATGKWIIFADADDLFVKDFNNILDKCINNDSDIIYFKIESRYSKTLERCSRGDFINQQIDSACQNDVDELKFRRLEPWAKLIRRDVICRNNLLYDETIAANDLMFSIKLAFVAKKIDVCKEIGYCLTERENSLAYTISLPVCDAKYHVIGRVNRYLIAHAAGKYHINIFPYILNYKKIATLIFVKRLINSLFSYSPRYLFLDLLKSLRKYFYSK